MNHGIIYKGPSLLDGKPIVVIGTYSKRNSKTGAVLQTYILCDDGLDPLEASKTGADFSICGDCIMRGTPTTDPKRKQAEKRTCYVNLGQGVLIVYRAYVNGVYPTANPRDIGRGRFVRVDALAARVRGIGPVGVARLRPWLFTGEPDPACSEPAARSPEASSRYPGPSE